MNKKLAFGLVAGLIVFSAFAAAYTLLSERPVASCFDSDGLNFSVKGVAFGQNLKGQNFTQYDYCITNNSVGEFACSSQGNTTLLQLYSQNCTCSDGKCI